MPIYEYVCQACGTRFEKLIRQAAQTSGTPPCPGCGISDTHRVISTFARHGQSGVDHEATQSERATAERMASITPREQIDKWRSQRDKKA
jgi:putative FmdB family regulatory protein